VIGPRLLLLFVAGAALDVAVAWGICRWTHVQATSVWPGDGSTQYGFVRIAGPEDVEDVPGRAQPEDVEWLGMSALQLVIRESTFLATVEYAGVAAGVEYQRFAYVLAPDANGGRVHSISHDRYFAVRVMAGWPCRSLSGGIADLRVIAGTPVSERDTTMIVESTKLPVLLGASTVKSIVIVPTAAEATAEFGRILPYGLLWPGFAINTLFYAGMLWVMFAGPFSLRRMIRRRRGGRGLCPACAYPTGQSPVCTECGHSVMPAKAGIQ